MNAKKALIFSAPSGAGKTSILRMIAGLTPLTSGSLLIDGKDTSHISVYNRDLSMAFERYVLYPFLTVEENIAFPLKVSVRKANYSANDITRLVGEVAKFLEIDPLLKRNVGELSGGQRQRVSLARALVRTPNVYLLDEPLSHLDAKLRNRLRGEIKRMLKDRKRTAVYVTHDFREAMSMADRVMVIEKGNLLQLGTPDEIYNHPASTVVADLVGDPPIDFFNCELRKESGQYRIVNSEFRLTLSKALGESIVPKADGTVSSNVIAGIRPIHSTIATGTGSAENPLVRGEVFVSEPSGSRQVVFVTVGSSQFKVVAGPEFNARIGDPVAFKVNNEKIRLFDAETKKTILKESSASR